MKHKWHKALDILLATVLAVAVVVFILMPFLFVLRGAFLHQGQFGLGNFMLIKWRSAVNSLRMGALTSLLSTTVAGCIALFLYIHQSKLKQVILVVLAITMISPPFVTALSYINLFGRRGLITYRLLGLSIWPYGLWGIVLMQTLSDISINTLILFSFMQQIDRTQIDASQSLGAKTNHIIVDILFPHMKNGLLTIAVLSFLRSVADFGTPSVIGGAYNVLATDSYFAVIAEGNIGKSAAINVLILLPSIFAFSIYQKNIKNTAPVGHGSYTSGTNLAPKGLLYRLFAGISIFFILWLGLQYCSIALSAFTTMRKGIFVFTLDNIKNTLPHINSSVWRSIVYSLISAGLGSVLGLLIAYYLKIRKMKLFALIDTVATLPYIIPGTFFGLGYLMFFSKPPIMIMGTAAIVVLNIVFKQLPFSTKMGNTAMADIGQDTLHSVKDLGGSRINEIVDIVFPLCKPALGVSFINAFTTTMTTVGSIIFLIYPSQKVLTIVMYDVIQSGKYDVGSVIALLIILICMLVNGLFLLLQRKRKHS